MDCRGTGNARLRERERGGEPGHGNETKLKRAEIEEIFARFAKASPEPLGELDFTTTFTLLVAVVLSAQTTDKAVNLATKQLFAVADTPEKMVALGEEKLMEYTKPLGFFRSKARNVLALSQALIERHGGEVPPSREALEALPGVGRKSANVILNTAFGEPVIAVDTHVFRVSNRTGLAPGTTPVEVEETLHKVVPKPYLKNAHHWLILHGRYVCKARLPECPRCLINDICRYPAKAV
jgi:endonuclease III